MLDLLATGKKKICICRFSSLEQIRPHLTFYGKHDVKEGPIFALIIFSATGIHVTNLVLHCLTAFERGEIGLLGKLNPTFCDLCKA